MKTQTTDHHVETVRLIGQILFVDNFLLDLYTLYDLSLRQETRTHVSQHQFLHGLTENPFGYMTTATSQIKDSTKLSFDVKYSIYQPVAHLVLNVVIQLDISILGGAFALQQLCIPVEHVHRTVGWQRGRRRSIARTIKIISETQ
ncbi:hypothetical protein ALC60_04877 [Trachymyrmex zeteki]|uniref:Uncharacterized protein n=1 Tax=Mycetomoellerius zeteki TaxID=64791 RepID=A0A151X7B7_9HYME|nr:hypothetical protein ALC60_04877 [Trachymyrmex zeteki]